MKRHRDLRGLATAGRTGQAQTAPTGFDRSAGPPAVGGEAP
ncbi:hypothetical protein [Micromonospora sp. NPDC047134]